MIAIPGTTESIATIDTSWIDRAEYPFEPRYLHVDGGRMHYIDEGQGPPLVMVHGTPSWSWEYRHLVKHLSASYRCIVPDHIGFGLSERPSPYTLRIPDHARNLKALIEHLGLEELTLVVHDFGGPIGLSYAIEHPENVRALVILNTWMWSLDTYPSTRRPLQFVASPLGQFLYKRFNFSARVILKSAWGDKSTLTKHIHQHYVNAFPTPESRQSTAKFAVEALASSEWYESLWSRRQQLQDKPALLVWGLKDPAFGGMLDRWRSLFPEAEVVAYPDAGHFPQEERAAELGPTLSRFLRSVYRS